MDHVISKNIRKSLKADCSKCFGLCCTALNIAASSDFAINKPAGTPCVNLQKDFRCKIHNNLREKGFKGCTVFDCLGAGQKVSQDTFNGQSWQGHPEIAQKMFRVFPIMEQLYEMMAFITEALSYNSSSSLEEQLFKHFEKLRGLIEKDAGDLLSLDLIGCRQPINELLLQTSDYIRSELSANVFVMKKGKNCRGVDWIGKSLKGKDLRTTDLRGAYLIACDLRNADLRGADLIGADLRDANVSGANLSTTLFLTQMQMNSAKGNAKTIHPDHIERPAHWGYLNGIE